MISSGSPSWDLRWGVYLAQVVMSMAVAVSTGRGCSAMAVILLWYRGKVVLAQELWTGTCNV